MSRFLLKGMKGCDVLGGGNGNNGGGAASQSNCYSTAIIHSPLDKVHVAL